MLSIFILFCVVLSTQNNNIYYLNKFISIININTVILNNYDNRFLGQNVENRKILNIKKPDGFYYEN
jgi:hypothetical protein